MQQQPGEEVGLDVALLALHAETLRTPGRVLIISVASECESGHRGHSDPLQRRWRGSERRRHPAGRRCVWVERARAVEDRSLQ